MAWARVLSPQWALTGAGSTAGLGCGAESVDSCLSGTIPLALIGSLRRQALDTSLLGGTSHGNLTVALQFVRGPPCAPA